MTVSRRGTAVVMGIVWLSTYGTDGYIIADGEQSVASYVQGTINMHENMCATHAYSASELKDTSCFRSLNVYAVDSIPSPLPLNIITRNGH